MTARPSQDAPLPLASWFNNIIQHEGHHRLWLSCTLPKRCQNYKAFVLLSDMINDSIKMLGGEAPYSVA